MPDLFFIRVRLLSVAIFLVGALLLGRLWVVQVISGETWRREAEAQYVVPLEDAFSRGTIFFRDKDGAPAAQAATLKSGFVLAVNPKAIADPAAIFGALKKIVPAIDEASFYLKAGKKDDPYEEVTHRVSPETARKIRDMGLPGVYLFEERWRYYPSGTLAAHLLGFVGL